MQIQINTDRNIEGHETLSNHVETMVVQALERFSEQITRIEVHISDENSDKGGENDKRCMIEARIENLQPVAVTHQDANLDSAVRGAIDKLKNMLNSKLGKKKNR
ncbi:HPF/RaiA family ribosome-associated protein [Nitrosomonas sp.]|uniref:HPF/RaiA family ribosome-associated protein n=1 Tax=Nitrosomonas sp. TaxID=42353 RepID=UPI001D8ED470|nr:HPF/RaiA family ribosome-associated protein [Nitrosomonas sp.]MCB1949226.1 HPF/RaiA family ribosome-associated protein [Nitrosomonas sp.]MCP5241943.1 HPF/RaiA family ribosome-associated protein [Burkholderiales bacterium]MDR4513276.1 HPF/RaiA family ribosome-associated protein [Nitrosomonas sp.]